jgi:beta-1,4-mannooligosaccharide/beta-1,4-mannosyl-N-acetylglucosamine phosphorylase
VIKTDKGWLLIYHAVGEIGDDICKAYGLAKRIERGYSICAALLDMNDPEHILCRTKNPIYIPQAPYELYGNDQYPVDVPAVVFPVGAIVRKGKLILYAGAGDKYIILLSCNLDDLVHYLWKYCKCVA